MIRSVSRQIAFMNETDPDPERISEVFEVISIDQLIRFRMGKCDQMGNRQRP